MESLQSLVLSLISREMDQYGKIQMGAGVGSAEFQEAARKVDLLCRAHAVMEEYGILTRTGRICITGWLRENIEGILPEDLSEAADDVFNGDLELIGGLYLLVHHSYAYQRAWEKDYDEDWEDQIR